METKPLSSGQRAMARAMALVAQGKRKDGRFEDGVNRPEIGTKTDKNNLHMCGYILDHSPSLADEVLAGTVALSTAYEDVRAWVLLHARNWQEEEATARARRGPTGATAKGPDLDVHRPPAPGSYVRFLGKQSDASPPPARAGVLPLLTWEDVEPASGGCSAGSTGVSLPVGTYSERVNLTP